MDAFGVADGRLAGAAIALLSVIALVPAARAQSAGCPLEATITERRALATVAVSSPCRRDPGQIVKVIYDDNTFIGQFDGDGNAAVSFVLTHPTGNDILIATGEGARLRRTIDAPDFGDVYRITMVWQSPVRVRLHVVEPGRRLNQLGDINETAPNKEGSAGLGTIDLAGASPVADASGDETASEQSYVLHQTGDRRRGVFTPYFEYPTRGATPEPPYCGTGALASVPYRLFVIDEGHVTIDIQHESPRAPCGVPLASLQQRIQGLQ